MFIFLPKYQHVHRYTCTCQYLCSFSRKLGSNGSLLHWFEVNNLPDLWSNHVVNLTILLFAFYKPESTQNIDTPSFQKHVYICMNQTPCDQIYIILPNHNSLLKMHIQGIYTFTCIWTYINIMTWKYNSYNSFWIFPI